MNSSPLKSQVVKLLWRLVCAHYKTVIQPNGLTSRQSLCDYDECHPPGKGTGMKCRRCGKHNV